jgi:hypothetical protein
LKDAWGATYENFSIEVSKDINEKRLAKISTDYWVPLLTKCFHKSLFRKSNYEDPGQKLYDIWYQKSALYNALIFPSIGVEKAYGFITMNSEFMVPLTINELFLQYCAFPLMKQMVEDGKLEPSWAASFSKGIIVEMSKLSSYAIEQGRIHYLEYERKYEASTESPLSIEFENFYQFMKNYREQDNKSEFGDKRNSKK